PVAQDNSYTVGEDAGAAVIGNALSDNTGAGVDSDPDGDTLVVTAQTGVSGSNGGVFSVNAAGVVTFDPNGDFEDLAVGESATTTLSYQISDGEGGFDTATITVTVNGANDVPEVVPGNQIPDQNDNDNEVITPINVTGAFTDVDTDVLTYTATGLPAGLTLNPSTGLISGTLDNSASQGGPGGNGVYSVTVTANDGNGGTVSDTFTYTVGNPVPVATDNDYTVGRDDAAAVIGNALSDNTGAGVDSDPDGDTLVVTAQTGVSGSNGGVFSIDAAGVVTFDPNGAFADLNPGDSRDTTLTYTISDGEGGTDTATITVTVMGANDPPVATDNDYAVSEDAGAAVIGNALTDNTGDGVDSDPNAQVLSVTPQSGVSGSAGGVFSIDAAGVITFDPNGDFEDLAVGESATTTFEYDISDGFGGTDTATITVTVNGANDAPEVVPGNQIPDQNDNDNEVITPIDVTGAFTDVDNSDVLTYTATGLPAGLTLNPSTGVISGTLDNSASQGGPGSDGVYSVTVTASDGNGGTVSDTFTYTVGNPVPVAQDNSYTVGEDAGAAVIGNALSDNTGAGVDSDPDGDTLVVTAQTGVSGSNGGVFSVNAAGVVTFDPNGDFEDLAVGESATTTLSYQISDGEGGFDTATITVTVNGANDVP
ncbi:tandem-95 repeat protein, partial [Hydrogenophaga aromaticivorans]|uniref:beta strand repeat-containing protein n=1 Tax=Hydrogenophaga aromaticivorans TaxID=2610898 RepID=UPI001B3912EC